MNQKKNRLDSLNSKKNQQLAQKQSKWLIQGLIFSGALNIALLTCLVFFTVKGSDCGGSYSNNSYQAALKADLTIQEIINDHLKCDFQELVSRLDYSQHVEDGVSHRDLALSVLCYKFDFDLPRALLGQSLEVRYFSGEEIHQSHDLPVFIGLNDDHYRLVYTFLQTEQWPYTSAGLFKHLQTDFNDSTLRDAIYLTKEFMYLDALFCKYNISQEDLLKIVSYAPFEVLDEFYKSFGSTNDFSDQLRLQFLSSYLEFGATGAAALILEVDPNYVLKKFSDQKIVSLLGLLEQKTKLNENFALHLVYSSRSEWVKQEASRLLYHYINVPFLEPFSLEDAHTFFSKYYQVEHEEPKVVVQAKEEKQMAQKQASTSKLYVVEKGDYLGKIARKHNVSVQSLKAVNHMDGDLIKVGMTLVIPD